MAHGFWGIRLRARLVRAAAAKEPVVSAIRTVLAGQIAVWVVPVIELRFAIRDMIDSVVPAVGDAAHLTAGHEAQQHQSREATQNSVHRKVRSNPCGSAPSRVMDGSSRSRILRGIDRLRRGLFRLSRKRHSSRRKQTPQPSRSTRLLEVAGSSHPCRGGSGCMTRFITCFTSPQWPNFEPN